MLRLTGPSPATSKRVAPFFTSDSAAMLKPAFFAIRAAWVTMAAGGLISHAHAQTQPQLPMPSATPSQSAESGHTLPTVNVTADREDSTSLPYAGGQVARGGRLGMLGNADTMKAPFGISSYTSQMMQDQQAATVADVVRNDASVRLSGHAGDLLDSFFIRGFPVGDQNSGEIAFDGIYGVAPNYRVLTDYAERIEVLRGPSALLYGMAPASSVGGVINIVPKRASVRDLTSFTADYASGSQFGGHLDLSRRFGEGKQFGIRFNGSHHEGDTVQDNQSRDADVGALALDYQGTRLRASLDLIAQSELVDAPARRPFLGSGLTAVPSAPNGRRNVSQGWEWFDTDDHSMLLRTEYDVSDGITLFADAGGGKTKVDRLFGNPSVLNPAGDTSTLPQRFRFDVNRTAADAGLRARFNTANVKHSLTLQASTYRDRLGRASRDGTAVLSNLYAPISQPAQAIAAPSLVPKVSDTQLTGLALADTLSLWNDRLQVVVGARHQQVESDNYSAATGTLTSSYDKSAVTPLAGVVIQPWKHVSLYANYIEGLSKGDIAPVTASNAGEAFVPYKAKQREIGVKFDQGSVITTLSVFHITKQAGQQTGSVFSVDGEQRNRGVELNVTGEAGRGLRLLGGVTLLDADLSKTSSVTTLGKHAVGVPSLQANLGMEWDVPDANGMALSANLIHTGKQYVDRANTLSLPAWTTLDIGARYRTKIAGRTTTFRANLRNAFDRNYWASVSQFSSLVQGAPRTLLMSAAVDF